MWLAALASFFAALCASVSAKSECVAVRGMVRCQSNPMNQMGVEVRLYDRDVGDDDLMAMALTDPNGMFMMEGCADDYDMFGVDNLPDPYISIRHRCGSGGATEELELPEFYTFIPDIHEVGVIFLDNNAGGGGNMGGQQQYPQQPYPQPQMNQQPMMQQQPMMNQGMMPVQPQPVYVQEEEVIYP